MKILSMTEKLDQIIETYNSEPFLFDNNVYRCYESCKKSIRDMEETGEVEWDDYDLYIDYISEKLGI